MPGKTLGKRKGNSGLLQLEEAIAESQIPRSITPYQDMNIMLGNNINKMSQAEKYRSDTSVAGAGIIGSGAWMWFPRTNCGPSFFYVPSKTAGSVLPISYLNFVAGSSITQPTGQYLHGQWQAADVQDYARYFTQVSLISASITIQYTGQLEAESGWMTGSHIYGISPGNLTYDDIENGQYVTRSRPSEGQRFIYLPMEGTDYEFYPTKGGQAHNQGAQPSGNENLFYYNGSTSDIVDGITTVTAAKYVDGSATGTSTPPTIAVGNADVQTQILYLDNTNYIAGYWTGLPPQGSWLRVDIMRKFNGIPLTLYRDIVEMTRSKKNYDSKKTFDILRDLCLQAPVGGHTMTEFQNAQESIVKNLMNIHEAIQTGQIMGSKTLDDFQDGLTLSSARQKGLVGTSAPLTKRMYPRMF